MNFSNRTPLLWATAVLAVAVPIAVQTLRTPRAGWKESQVPYSAPPVIPPAATATAKTAEPVVAPPGPPPPVERQPELKKGIAPRAAAVRPPPSPIGPSLEAMLPQMRKFLDTPLPEGVAQER